ncbi:MAG: 4Fe-4S binding protein [Eggerthellaceae bacterium]|jgi:ferredoxin|nr:4Fe-4S binding protein [Eggerthellaceae bacterium]
MAQFRNFIGVLEKLQSKNVVVHEERCAVVRNRHATCTKCADACTSGCISYANNELTIDPEKCVGCGTCATVCPTEALEARNPDDAALFSATLHAMHANDGNAVIACDQVLSHVRGLVDESKVAPVVCLGRVDESLIALMALGGGSKVTLVCGDCAHCPQKVGRETAELVARTANDLMEVWNCRLRAKVRSKFPASVRRDPAYAPAYDKGRRAFFKGAGDTAREAAGAVAAAEIDSLTGETHEAAPFKPAKVGENGVLPQHTPTRRKRLLKTLSEMGEPADEMIACRLWGHVVIDMSACNSCQMCATFCPTGALTRFRDPDGTVGVMHYAGACVKCRTCTDICPKNALTVYDAVFAEDLMHGNIEKYPMDPPKIMEGGVHQMRGVMQTLVTHSRVSDN